MSQPIPLSMCSRRESGPRDKTQGHTDPSFPPKDHSDAKHKYTEDDIVKMLTFLIDNIFVEFAGQIFQQVIGIPMGTNCAPLLADLFLYSYEAEFIQRLLAKGEKKLAQTFNFSFRYIDDLLSLNNPRFHDFTHLIYPKELELKDTTDTPCSASYLDLSLKYDPNGKLYTRIYDKRDDFNFSIVNFPFLCSNIPASPAYGVYTSQLIRYDRACSNYEDFIARGQLLTTRLQHQGYTTPRLKSTFRKFFGRQHDIVGLYEKSASENGDIAEEYRMFTSISPSLCAFVLILVTCCPIHTTGSTKSPPLKHDACNIRPVDDTFSRFMDDPRVVLNEFHFHMANYSSDPLYTDIGENYKPWRWHRTRTQHGRTLLMLSFHYDVLSMSVLTIGVKAHVINLIDKPHGCFGNISAEERVTRIRQLILDEFKLEKKTVHELEYENHLERTVFVCNEIVRDREGYAEFLNRCCHQDSNGILVCTDQVEDEWITLLYVCISLVKVIVFFFSPLLLPSHMYSASYVASEYVVKLHREIKMKLFITESTETSIRYKKRLTMEDISEWKRFRKDIEECPMDEIIPIKIPELRIKVKGKRIIPENEPPTGLLRTLYDNLVRCKIKRLSPFKECCDSSVYASLEPQISHKCTWYMFVQNTVKVSLLFLIPIPYYIRVFIYYQFEQTEILRRHFVADALNLKEGFNFYRSNIIQYLTPVHGVFVATYIFYLSAGLVIGFSDEVVREKLKSIARGSLQDMLNVQRTSVLQVILRIGLWPFGKCGLLAIFLGPIYASVTAPFCFMIFALYCIPTIYLSYRLLYHSRKKISYSEDLQKPIRPITKTKEKVKKVQKRLSTLDRKVHRRNSALADTDDKMFPCTWGTGKLNSLRRVLVQSVVGLFCLACLYAMVLLFVEAVGLLVEVLAFTMMGIIVNAGSTLRYVSMALLVIVYMHDCYSNVYESYLTFNKTVIEDVMDRVEDLKKVASLPSNMQENAGFQVKPVETLDEIPTTLSLEKKEPSWKIGHLLLFLDSYDTPRIPLNLFKRLCEVRIHGAPGPVYINLLRATGKFLIIVVFLFFVMIVVMAFGNVHQISSTNQTLATLAGGFVPMLLKNVLPRKSVKLNLKTLSFKGQIDEIISEFKQNWPLYDFMFEHDEPQNDFDSKSLTGNGDDDGNPENKNVDIGNKKEDRDGDTNSSDRDKPKNEKSKDDKFDKPKEGILNTVGTYIKDKEKKVPNEKLSDQRQSIDKPINGIPIHPSTARLLPRHSVVDNNYVDLFIDLSVAETATPWHIYGSSESLPSASMLPDSEYVIEGYAADRQVPHITIDVID